MTTGSKISKNYVWELTLLYKYRSLDDGLSLFEFKSDIDWYDGDHCPKADISLRLFNWTIFEFNIYNVNHADDSDDGISDIQRQCWKNAADWAKEDAAATGKAFIEQVKKLNL